MFTQGPKQLALPPQWRRYGAWLLVALVVMGLLVPGRSRNAGPNPRPPDMLPLRDSEAAVVLKAPPLSLMRGETVQVVVTPRRGEGVAAVVPGRVLALLGDRLILAMPRQAADKHAAALEDGRAEVALPASPK